MKFTIYQSILLVALLSHGVWASSDVEFEIVVEKPRFVLPQFTGSYQEREASIAPEEYETAERLRTMLDNNQQAEVLEELEQFYSIEISPAMLTLKAQIYFSLKMYDKAEATFLSVLKRKPQLVRVHSDLAQLYLIQDDFKNARKYFSNAVAFGSNEALIHGQLAYLNLKMYGAFSAISEYQQAMSLEPENRQWQQGLLAALSQARMYEAAEALLRELINQNPDEPELWLNRAALALQKEDEKQALISLEMAILLGDNDIRNLKTASLLHLKTNSYDRALYLMDQSLSQKSFDMASANEYLAWLTQLDMWDKASQLLDLAEKHVSGMKADDQSQYFLHRARIEEHLEKVSEATNYFKQSLGKNPTNGETLLSYAQFASSQKSYVEAELLYVRAEAVSGFEKRALLGRSQLYIEMQDYPSALNHMKTTLQKFPEMIDLKDKIEVIENIIRAKTTTRT